MNFPYSNKKWMTISLAAVLTTAIGAGTLTASANTATTEQTKTAATAKATATKETTAIGTEVAATATDAKDQATTGTPTPAANSTTTEKATAAPTTTTTTTTAPTAPTTTTPATTTPSASVGEDLTLEKAIQQALETNATLATARLDAKNADLNQMLSYKTSADMPADMIESLNAAKAKYISNAQGEMTKKLNALQVTATEGKIKLGAQQAYYNLIFAQDDLNLKQQSLARAQTQLKVANAAFKVGTKAKTDVLQAEMGLAGAQANLTNAKNSVEVARMDLNDFLGVDLTKDWKVVSSNKQTAPIKMTMKQAEDQAITKRVEMTKVQEELKLAELNVKLIEEYSALSTMPGRVARNNVEKSQLAIEEQKRAISKEVSQAYLNLNAAREAIDFQKTAKDSAAESYRLTNLRFENGLATTLEVIQAEEELSNRENQYQKAILQYNLAVVNFETALGN
ncbi:TolC family protein [Brevibacillus choshinensis]|uniref:TolC family protein n=1 Tax=Brevibacillus choshinensis TaxID=54911 RepID=UPI002E215331|nr:TolC family protein [Brevibacillus choshinensis]MED4586966.1 TolC family protein [Brevibacillus choshinensis]